MPRAPKDPPRIPGFEILEAIGSGGQGAVWRARQKSLDRVVAMKVLWPEDAADPALARRFIDEARIASKLNHPNIIQVIDVGETEGTYWYAMEYVAGVTALELFRERGPLPEGEVLEIAWQVAQALQHGADRGLVHGDLKPENVLITPEGVAKVVDFGLARYSEKRGWRTSKTFESVQGTEGFVAPEVLDGRSTGDARSDLFALGVTMYELLTTTLPPPPARGSALGPDIRERRTNTTPRTVDLVRRLLAPDPERRPESAAKLLEELGRRSSITLPPTVSPVAPVKPPQSARLKSIEEAVKKSGRLRAILWTAAAAALIAAIWGGMRFFSKPPHGPAPKAGAGGAATESRPPAVEPESKEPAPGTAAGSGVPASSPAATSRRGHSIATRVPPKKPESLPESRETAPIPVEPQPAPPTPAPPEPAPESQRAEPPTPPPTVGAGHEDRAAPVLAVTTRSAGVRIFAPPAEIPGAAWTVIVPAGDLCDLVLRPPAEFDSKDTTSAIEDAGAAKGFALKAGENGAWVLAFRPDRLAPWGPRELAVRFRRGGASHKVRLRFEVVRPTTLPPVLPAPALRDALRWLERHQAPDGAITAASFFKQCTGRRCTDPGTASCDGGVTALAVLAALRAGESGDWVMKALSALVAMQAEDGRFGSAEGTHGTYAHMMATEACALGWYQLGDPRVRAAAQRGIEAIEAARNLQANGGAWRYGIQSGDNDTSVTIWAMRALLAGKMAGLKVADAAIEAGAAWIRRVTETNTNDPAFGRIGYNAPGGLPVRLQDRILRFPAQLSESLTAGALSVALASGDRKAAEKPAYTGLALVLTCRPHWDASTPDAARFIRDRLNNPNADLSVISPKDYYYWTLASSLFRTWKIFHGRGIPDDKRWNLAKFLTPVQRKDGCAAGSFDADDPWAAELGRSGSTALLALALANEQYQSPLLDEPQQ